MLHVFLAFVVLGNKLQHLEPNKHLLCTFLSSHYYRRIVHECLGKIICICDQKLYFLIGKQDAYHLSLYSRVWNKRIPWKML